MSEPLTDAEQLAQIRKAIKEWRERGVDMVAMRYLEAFLCEHQGDQ